MESVASFEHNFPNEIKGVPKIEEENEYYSNQNVEQKAFCTFKTMQA